MIYIKQLKQQRSLCYVTRCCDCCTLLASPVYKKVTFLIWRQSAIFSFGNMQVLNFCTVYSHMFTQNFIAIGWSVAKILQIFDFQYGGLPPSWIRKTFNFNYHRCLPQPSCSCKISPWSDEQLQRYCEYVAITVPQIAPNFTGWAVARTYCISHSAKCRKTANFDPWGSQNLCIDLHELDVVDYSATAPQI